MLCKLRLGHGPLNQPVLTSLRSGEVEILSPRGVDAIDQFLVDALPSELDGPVLTGLRPEPVVAMVAQRLLPAVDVSFFHFDQFFTRRAAGTIGQNGDARVQVTLGPDLPLGPFRAALFGFARDGELQLTKDVVEQVHRALDRGGVFWAATDNPKDSRLANEIQRVFGGVSLVARDGRGRLYSARKKRKESELRGYQHTFTVEMLGRPFQFTTRPGVFSHGHLDEGSRALVEVADLHGVTSLLDVGCGFGAVGIMAAVLAGGCRAVLVDSNARAVDLVQRNAAANGLDRFDVVLSDTVEIPSGETFDRVLANPPYFARNLIAELFIRQAFELVKPGGLVQIVTKRPRQVLDIAEPLFGNGSARPRRGYSVVAARKPSGPNATTAMGRSPDET